MGRARKERMENGAGGKLPKAAAALSSVSYCDTTVSRGSGESKPAIGNGKDARISRSAQTTSPRLLGG
jgi:hypothetical protein